MKFLQYLLIIPLLLLGAWVVYMADSSAEGIFLSTRPDDCLNTKLVLVLCIFYGYLFGRINSWFAYYPLRRELRLQKKSNKNLNKEHDKLSKTVSELKQDVEGLQKSSVENTANSELAAENKTPWWQNFKQKFSQK